MKGLLKPIFKGNLKSSQSKLYLAFTIFPVFVVLTQIIPGNFMKISSNSGQPEVSCLDFFIICQMALFDIFLPFIAMIFLVDLSFGTEINSGRMFLYKDINRKNICDAKTFAMVLEVILFHIILFVISVAAYYVYFHNQSYATGSFIPAGIDEVYFDIIHSLGNFFMIIIAIYFASFLSIRFSTASTFIATMLLGIMSNVAEYFKYPQYLFPNALSKNVLKSFGFGKTLLLSVVLTVVYVSIFRLLAVKSYRKVEY